MVSFLIAAIPIALEIRSFAASAALENAAAKTQPLADYALGPLVTEELLAQDPAAIALVRAKLEPWMDDGTIRRIKVWDMSGKILYSDVSSLIGKRFALPDVGVPRPGSTEPGGREPLTNLAPESAGTQNNLVEVLVRTTAANGAPLIIEADLARRGVFDDSNAVLIKFAPAFLISLAVLQLTQLIRAVRLARRIQGHQAMRRQLMQYAINASDLERRRIARDLHDNVIQDLAGLSYALEAVETRATADHRPLITRARSILQGNVRTLRGMATELYPPDLDQLGLPGALMRLADSLIEQGIAVHIQVPDDCDLDRDRSAIFYRVAREVLRNISKYAQADSATLTLVQNGSSTVMTIQDDGRGFDPAASAPDGHLGLRIVQDTMRAAGGTLEVSSREGGGTTAVATLDGAPSQR